MYYLKKKQPTPHMYLGKTVKIYEATSAELYASDTSVHKWGKITATRIFFKAHTVCDSLSL